MYFLDTNICIHYLNGRYPAIKERIIATPPGTISIPSIVRAELLFGAYKSRRRNENIHIIERFLEPFHSVGFDEEAAYFYADIRFKSEEKGTPVGPNDLCIAAVVMQHGGTLVTRNTGEFQLIEGLILEDWALPA